MHSSDLKTNEDRVAIQNQLDLHSSNHCITGILSICGAGKIWAEHRHCSYAVKSDFANKCMHYNASMDGHCDCIDAQKEAIKIFEDFYE